MRQRSDPDTGRAGAPSNISRDKLYEPAMRDVGHSRSSRDARPRSLLTSNWCANEGHTYSVMAPFPSRPAVVRKPTMRSERAEALHSAYWSIGAPGRPEGARGSGARRQLKRQPVAFL